MLDYAFMKTQITSLYVLFSDKWKEVKKNRRSTAEQRKNMRADEEERERIIKVNKIIQNTNLQYRFETD